MGEKYSRHGSIPASRLPLWGRMKLIQATRRRYGGIPTGMSPKADSALEGMAARCRKPHRSAETDVQRYPSGHVETTGYKRPAKVPTSRREPESHAPHARTIKLAYKIISVI